MNPALQQFRLNVESARQLAKVFFPNPSEARRLCDELVAEAEAQLSPCASLSPSLTEMEAAAKRK